MTPIYTATEDELSEVLVDKVIEPWSESLLISVRMRRRGNGYLRAKLPELVVLARANVPVVVLTDLDCFECPPRLIDDWFQNRQRPDQLLFRVAVREAEAWLMADRVGFSEFFGVPERYLPARPEDLDDPKATMLSVIARQAPREIRSDMVARTKSGFRQGLAYNARCRQFVSDYWRLERAAVRADSLARASQRIEELAHAVGQG